MTGLIGPGLLCAGQLGRCGLHLGMSLGLLRRLCLLLS